MLFYSVLPHQDDSRMSTSKETTPHDSRAADLVNKLLSPLVFTCAQDRLLLLADEPTLPMKTLQFVGKLHQISI